MKSFEIDSGWIDHPKFDSNQFGHMYQFYLGWVNQSIIFADINWFWFKLFDSH